MDISSNPDDLALQLLKYATSGNWRAFAAVGVLLIVWFIRNVLLSPKALGRYTRLNWFKTDKGGVVLNFVVSALGGAGNALMANQAITRDIMLTAIVNSCIAAGVFVSFKKLFVKDDKSTVNNSLILLPFLLFIHGCGLASAYATLATAENVVVQARKQFPDLDREHRMAIARAAVTYVEGEAKLKAWDDVSSSLQYSIDGSHAANKLSRDALVDISKGIRDKKEISYWITPALNGVINLKNLLKAAGVPLKGL